MRFGSDIHAPVRKNVNNLVNPLNFSSAAIRSEFPMSNSLVNDRLVA